MLSNGCVLYPEQYGLILKTSFLLLGTTLYSIKMGHYGLSILPGLTFITSVIYWHKPDKSWRRTIDVYCVRSSLIYQSFIAIGAENKKPYFLFTLMGILFYIYGIHLHNKKQYWASTYAHCMLHIMGNLACIVLYSGRIGQ